MKKVNRTIYVFKNGTVMLRRGTNFQKLFHKWYMYGNDIVPNRIYDYLERLGILKDRL